MTDKVIKPYIPHYLKDVGCKEELNLSPKDKLKRQKSFINRARALLVHLGIDPSPNNVNRVQVNSEDERQLIVNNRIFRVLSNDEVLEELELIILSYPQRLPSNILALFFTKLNDQVPFDALEIIAMTLKKVNTLDSIWAMHRLIDTDTFRRDHIQEIIDQVGIDTLFYKDLVSSVKFRNDNYTIIEKN